jgi:ribosome-associated translation inhibitor RaiA
LECKDVANPFTALTAPTSAYAGKGTLLSFSIGAPVAPSDLELCMKRTAAIERKRIKLPGPPTRPPSKRSRIPVGRTVADTPKPEVAPYKPSVLTHIRAFGIELDDEARTFIRRKVDRAFQKFESSVQRVTLRLADVNGPRGGVDRVCRLKVVLRENPILVIEKHDASWTVAVNTAVASAEKAVRRVLQRTRTKPMKKSVASAGAPFQASTGASGVSDEGTALGGHRGPRRQSTARARASL